MPRKEDKTRAQTNPKGPISRSTTVTISSDCEGRIDLIEPKHKTGGKKQGYSGWKAAVERAHITLQHDTDVASNFFLLVAGHITEIYGQRQSKQDKYMTNPVVVRMQGILREVHRLFKRDPRPGGAWVDKLPGQEEIFALTFSAHGFKLHKTMSGMFDVWGMGDWARVPEPKAVKEEHVDTSCKGDCALRDMEQGRTAAELAARAVARVARLANEFDADAAYHQATREEDKAQVNDLIEVVASLSDRINQMHGVMPADGGIGAARRDKDMAPAGLLKYMACIARVSKTAAEPRTGDKRKRVTSDEGEDMPNPFVTRRTSAPDPSRNFLKKGKLF